MFTIAACLAATAVLTLGATVSLIANDLDEDLVRQSSWADNYKPEPVPALVEWEWDAEDYEAALSDAGWEPEESVTTPDPAPEVMAHLHEVEREFDVLEETFEREVFNEVKDLNTIDTNNTYEAFPRSVHTVTTVPPMSTGLKTKALKINDLERFRIQTKPPEPVLPADMWPMPMDVHVLERADAGWPEGGYLPKYPPEKTMV